MNRIKTFISFCIIATSSVAFVALFSSCSSENILFTEQVLFEVHYTNYAWGYSENGYLIDSTGTIHSFDLSKKTYKWNYKDDNGYISKDGMRNNLLHCDSVVGKVAADSLQYFRDKINGASRGKISDPVGAMADFGQIRYSAYIYDRNQQRYKEVLIQLYGDMMSDNNSAEAKQLYEWLVRSTKRR